MELYTYYRSTSSYRVRIALALKGLAYQSLPVNLLQGEQRGAGYVAVNPQGRVPALRTDGGELLVQSPAIIEYLEEVYPQPALLPATAERARQGTRRGGNHWLRRSSATQRQRAQPVAPGRPGRRPGQPVDRPLDQPGVGSGGATDR